MSAVLKDNSDFTLRTFTGVPSPDFAGQSGTAIVKGFDFQAFLLNQSLPDSKLLRSVGVNLAPLWRIRTLGATFELTGTKLNLLGTSVVKTVQDAYTTVTDVGLVEMLMEHLTCGDFGAQHLEALLESVLDSSFGVKLSLIDNYYTSAAPQGIKLTRLELQVYYKVPVETVYAYDPIGKQDLALRFRITSFGERTTNPGVIDANQ